MMIIDDMSVGNQSAYHDQPRVNMCRQRSLLSLVCRVSDSIVHRFLVGLVPAPTAEGSVVNHTAYGP